MFKPGDLVTASDTQGGKILTNEGFILGEVLEVAESANPDNLGWLTVRVLVASGTVHLVEEELNLLGKRFKVVT